MRSASWLAVTGMVMVALLAGSLAWFGGAQTASAQDAKATNSATPNPTATTEAQRRFDTQIAPILSRHCLECHDGTARKGKLDLSRKTTAFKGGKNGVAIVPGDSANSLLWENVESGEMPPEKRPRISDAEKKLLRDWIDTGAVWSGDEIDPAAHQRGDRAAGRWLRRLTMAEYIQTVRDAVGVDVAYDAPRILPPDHRADGFSNTAYNLNIDLGHVEAYAKLAEIIVGRMDPGAFAAQFSKCGSVDEKCMRQVIGSMGKWLLRGPLEEREIASFLRVSAAVADEGGNFAEAVSYIIEAMLQSPRFIYRMERERGDGASQAAGEYELASRLSYILWGGPPDRELMRAADAGELSRKETYAAQVERMLKDQRTIRQSSRFMEEWLHLNRLADLRPDKARFPKWNAQLAADMRAETLACFEEVAWKRNRPLAELMNAQVTFVTPRLAEHYGLTPIESDTSPSMARGRHGLEALYTFQEGTGSIVRDMSGVGTPLHMTIQDSNAVKWGQGSLTLDKPTLIATAAPPKRLINAVRKSGAISIEAWITPLDTKQKGPARIVTLSNGASERNFTLGQDETKYEVRLRTQGTSTNGSPSLAGPKGTVEPTKRTHLVYIRPAGGKARLYINGKERAAFDVRGDLSRWDESFRMALGNEPTMDRPWLGTLHQVAIYSRALSAEEIGMPIEAEGPTRYDLAAVPERGGLLTQGSVLTVGGDDASMVTRGLFVLHDLLYSAVGSAPPCVDTTPVPSKPGLSQRGVAEVRLSDASCSSCHAKFEPLAFGLERFDGVGAYHEVDAHGNKLREDGKILFPGSDQPVTFETAAQFMDLLASSDRVQRNMTRKVSQFALGRPLVPSDGPTIDKIHEASQKDGGTYASLLRAIVMSDLVRKTTTEKKP